VAGDQGGKGGEHRNNSLPRELSRLRDEMDSKTWKVSKSREEAERPISGEGGGEKGSGPSCGGSRGGRICGVHSTVYKKKRGKSGQIQSAFSHGRSPEENKSNAKTGNRRAGWVIADWVREGNLGKKGGKGLGKKPNGLSNEKRQHRRGKRDRHEQKVRNDGKETAALRGRRGIKTRQWKKGEGKTRDEGSGNMFSRNEVGAWTD